MNEEQSIEHADKLDPLDKLAYYMEYYCNCLESKVVYGYMPKTFEQFKSERNIIRHDVGEIWKERGFASQKWVSLTAGSLYHSVFHNIKLSAWEGQRNQS